MHLFYYLLSSICIAASLLPLIPHQHWFFRIWEFARFQVVIIQLTVLVIGLFFFEPKTVIFWGTILISFGFIINHIVILIPYTVIYKRNTVKEVAKDSELISIISVNVYQFNNEYQRLIDLVNEVKPDILLTMESNQAWENALTKIENDYPNFKKVALENTYGIHFYTRLKVESIKVNYFIADDLPSIEASLLTDSGERFTFFGVHPPPPSPTEEETSKERDGELLSIAKEARTIKDPVIVVGDFNNVAWARASVLFRKTSELIDPRIGRGFVSTFHAKYWLLRFPIDLFFHSTDIFIEDFKTLRNIGSDHLPLYCTFFINKKVDIQEDELETLHEDDLEEVDELIEKGIEEDGNRPTVAEE
ncbi:endonuclease/exonuclease/phosphatase family protein [Kaistella flava (ex Peng et al. 2021)]|uniref:Endonuclease/exonuclease/phosphatase family protein n=1 Tax=Kaistella flava (ex Peng et al. 2021) TaxID=2038776 RepID=A0A7M2Y454_9FLAO|nr:endonuclease/exonuclease/phosphatase family protein [Kaistella flava (ex Peng et al. 2021)]